MSEAARSDDTCFLSKMSFSLFSSPICRFKESMFLRPAYLEQAGAKQWARENVAIVDFEDFFLLRFMNSSYVQVQQPACSCFTATTS